MRERETVFKNTVELELLLINPEPRQSAPVPLILSLLHRAETPNTATDPLYLMARYRPGDLGLVPRPTWKHKSAFSRTGAPSTGTQLPLNRFVKTWRLTCLPAGGSVGSHQFFLCGNVFHSALESSKNKL